MKKLCLIISVTVLSLGSFAQKEPAKPIGAAGPVMKNSLDSFSYALGQNLAAYYKMQGVREYNYDLIIKAIKDVLNNRKELSDREVNKILAGYFSKAKTNRLTFNKAESEAFLAANSKKPGVFTTASGLQYQVTKSGEGAPANQFDTVLVRYRGSIVDGTVFDSTDVKGAPAKFVVGSMITGWTEALTLMPKGSKWKIFIPSHLAYGETGAGDKIGPNMALVFEIELVNIFRFNPPKLD